MLFKLLALVVLFILFIRSIGYILRFLLGGMAGRASKDFQEGYGRGKKAPGGNVNIDFDPKERKKKKDGFKGGDYVDYEEVK